MTDENSSREQPGSSAEREVAPAQWIKFFDDFSRRHEGWLATVTVNRGAEHLTILRDRPLEGVEADHINPNELIYISAGEDGGDQLTHTIARPVRVVEVERGTGVNITASDKSVTTLRLRNIARAKPPRRAGSESKAGQNTPRGGAEREAHVPVDDAQVTGTLAVPKAARGVVVFAYGSGSYQRNPSSRQLTQRLQEAGFATLLLNLLTAEEESVDLRTATMRYNVDMLARRLIAGTWWLVEQPEVSDLPVGFFGSSSGAAAALVAAAELANLVMAVVCRSGRLDLAGPSLQRVLAPTLLVLGGQDSELLEQNLAAMKKIPAQKKLEVIPGASRMFDEPGALDVVAEHARGWFAVYLNRTGVRPVAA